jgi:ribosomal protein L6P/L9E
MKIFKKNKMFFFFEDFGTFTGGNLGVSYKKLNVNSIFISKKDSKNFFFFNLKQNLNVFKNLIAAKFEILELGCFLEVMINGVGYKCWRLNKNDLLFNLGYSHFIAYKNTFNIFFRISRFSLKCFSINLEKLGLMISEIITFRPVDAYKGKGLKLSTTNINLKVGKQR